MLEWLWPAISERLWRLTLTEVGLLLILGAICIYGGRMLSQLRRVNQHLRALRNDEDRRRARTERELLALDLDRRAANLLPKMPGDGPDS
jgi:hypothetical protein